MPDDFLVGETGSDHLVARGHLHADGVGRLDGLDACFEGDARDHALAHADGVVNAACARGFQLGGHDLVEVTCVAHDGKVGHGRVHSLDIRQVLVPIVIGGDHEGEAVRPGLAVALRIVDDAVERHLVFLVGPRAVHNRERAELAVAGHAWVGIHADLTMHFGNAARGAIRQMTQSVHEHVIIGRECFDFAQAHRIVMSEKLAAHALVDDAHDIG